MKRVLLVLTFLIVTAAAVLASMTPCPAPSSGTAYPMDGAGGNPTYGDPVDFAVVSGLPPTLLWDGRGAAQFDANGYSTSLACGGDGFYPVLVIRWFEDEFGDFWCRVLSVDEDHGFSEQWYQVPQ